ncbi:MAG: 30S ribosomal protein S18 [Terriglobales bacterium]
MSDGKRTPGSGGSASRGSSAGPKKPFLRRRKVCKFCVERVDKIDYKDYRMLQQFVAERGKIVPRRISGTCTRHQRRLTRAIKQARQIALLPFAAEL